METLFANVLCDSAYVKFESLDGNIANDKNDTEMFPTKKWMEFCQLVEHTFIWIIYHMMAEAAASVQRAILFSW